MESIISYFGTYKPAADGAVASFKFEYLCTLGFAAIVIFLGRAIVARSETLRKYAIPAPVISGLIFSIIVSCIKGAGIVGISFDATIMKDLCQNLFFLCVGFGQRKDVKACGRKALCPDRIRCMPPDHLPGPFRLCPEPADRHASAPGPSVLFRSHVRRRWYCFCIWPDL